MVHCVYCLYLTMKFFFFLIQVHKLFWMHDNYFRNAELLKVIGFSQESY